MHTPNFYIILDYPRNEIFSPNEGIPSIKNPSVHLIF